MRKYSVLVLLVLNIHYLYGQLSVQSTNPINNKLSDIVKSLVGQGVRVSNITSNQPNFTDVCGTFSEPTGQFGITKGLLMTSGNLVNAVGPNSFSNTTQMNSTSGDSDLSMQVGAPTLDACVIEFDIITSSNKISFNYVFASEEYLEFVGSNYNDAFGFFISGPGISGNQNIALLPGTSIPVSINNVNKTLNSTYYRDNGNGIFSGGPILEYDGYTSRMKAEAFVFPCSVYHLKLVIADVGDRQYDSGVFIEAGSLSGNDALMIGDIVAPDSVHVCIDKLPIELKAGINPVPNYTWTKDGVEIATGSKFYSPTSGGYYKVKAYRDSTCFWFDSIFIKADSVPKLIVSKDTSICPGSSAQLNVQASGGLTYIYSWSPSSSLSSSVIPNPIATPTSNQTYTVIVKSGLCANTASVLVGINKPIKLKDTLFYFGCINSPVQLNVPGGANYVWTPGLFLNDSTIANPIATISTSTLFKVVADNTCYKDSAQVLVTVSSKPIAKAYGDTTICYDGQAFIWADFNSLYTYSWSPSNTLQGAASSSPTAFPKKSTSYVVVISNQGCNVYDTVLVIVREEVRAQIVNTFPYGEVPWTVHFRNFSLGADSYTWYFESGATSTQFEPSLYIQNEGYHKVILKALNNNGCFDYDTLVLEAYALFIPNLITPNGDGLNDTFVLSSIGNRFDVDIYNRWGDRVYKSANYRNDWSGEGLSDGVYYYLIKDTLFDKEYKGWVQVIH